MLRFRYGPALVRRAAFTLADVFILLALAALFYAGVRLAFHAPGAIRGPEISLSVAALPWYALLSLGRMTAAYALSFLFSLAYGYGAARSPAGEKVLIPLLDVLQSVPILSFLPVVLLGFSAVLPQKLAAELAAVVLIFTSQAWNLTFCFYQALTTLPDELREASAVFRLDPWLRLKKVELPFAALALVWNSMMSWSGGWFFLMAAEIFHVGARDFRLPGLGSYLQVAAGAGDLGAIVSGLTALVAVIVLLDQLVWRPLLCWADKFKVETVQGDAPPRSWFYDLMARSALLARLQGVMAGSSERVDRWFHARYAGRSWAGLEPPARPGLSWRARLAAAVVAPCLLYGAWRAGVMLTSLAAASWTAIGLGTLATMLRVTLALALALVWTVPVGVVIGTKRRIAELLQPIVQVIASVPATAVFPLLVLVLIRAPGGLAVVSTLLMLLGTQWYLLFNVIAGAAAIPQDLRDTTALLGLGRSDRWRVLVLPSLFPYLITGSITAGGGAWNASIVAEHVEFGGRTHATLGVGALIADATGRGDYPLLLGSTLALVGTVILINRQLWRRLYRRAQDRYRLE